MGDFCRFWPAVTAARGGRGARGGRPPAKSPLRPKAPARHCRARRSRRRRKAPPAAGCSGFRNSGKGHGICHRAAERHQRKKSRSWKRLHPERKKPQERKKRIGRRSQITGKNTSRSVKKSLMRNTARASGNVFRMRLSASWSIIRLLLKRSLTISLYMQKMIIRPL